MNKTIKYNDKLNVIRKTVRKYRELNNWSLSQLSDKLMFIGLDIPKSSLTNIENGKCIVKEYEFYGTCNLLLYSEM